MRQNFFTANLFYGEISVRRNIPTAKFPRAKFAYGENSLRRNFPYGEISLRRNFLRRNFRSRPETVWDVWFKNRKGVYKVILHVVVDFLVHIFSHVGEAFCQNTSRPLLPCYRLQEQKKHLFLLNSYWDIVLMESTNFQLRMRVWFYCFRLTATIFATRKYFPKELK